MREADGQDAQGRLARVPLTRREFLYYLEGASMALSMAEAGGAAIWFALPRSREGEFSGVFTVPVSNVPPADSGPREFAQGRFWLVSIGEASLGDARQPQDYPLQVGVRAIYRVCTHLGCLYRWVPANDRFECPCHGSKFLRTGVRIDGPARWNLDAFVIEVVDQSGIVLSRSEPSMGTQEGTPAETGPEAVALRVDTRRRIQGAPNSRPGGGR